MPVVTLLLSRSSDDAVTAYNQVCERFDERGDHLKGQTDDR
jgi:hypothetical protein